MADAPARRKKYRHPDFDDSTIEGLMRYFRFASYGELRWFLNSVSGDRKYVLPEIQRD
jgi:hypothetical protein